ncbi:MAG: hypothetical protein ACM359_00540, partial [Bacillota bacterium]
WTEYFSGLASDFAQMGREAGGKGTDALMGFWNDDAYKRVGRYFDQVRANAAQTATAMEGTGNAARNMALKIETAAAASGAKVKDILAKLQEKVDEYGMTDAQKMIRDLKAAGASDADLNKAMGLNDTLEQLKRQDELSKMAQSLLDKVATPLEVYESKIGDLNEMLQAGVIDWELYTRGVQLARSELEKASTAKGPEAFQAGTAEAQRYIYDIQTRGMQRLTRDDIPKKQLAEAQDGNRLLERIERNTRSGETAGSEDLVTLDL